ncbi:MAG: uroporphyrinogen-III C-methyltransferase [Proteobacteria bacterium]|nr:uroporphyrinogen-III C-methyltransferase [Pseudomonadota bacterium]
MTNQNASPQADTGRPGDMTHEPAALLSAAPTPLWLRALAVLRRPAALFAVLLLLLLGWQWLDARSDLTELQQELTRRLAEGDAAIKESRTLTRQNQELLQTLTARIILLEAKQAEAQSQQLALESMYQELSRSRDERVLAEVEQTVTLAAQQLHLTGNVEAVLIALQGVDARLARSGQNRLLPLRKLINRDIERLRALPLADVPGIAVKLEGVISGVDALPLAFEQRIRVEPPARARSNVVPKTAAASTETGFWQGLGRDLWTEFRQLIRIERIDQPEAVLLAPSQVFFLRENLKLRLIDARLALLQRDGRTYRDDLRQSRELLERYFDTREKAVSNSIATLKGLSGADLSLELPTLVETLASIRNFRLPPEKDSLHSPPSRSGVAPASSTAGAAR